MISRFSAFVIVTFIFLNLSCVKNKVDEKPNYGPEASTADINNSMKDVYQQRPGLEDIKIGETVETETYTTIENFPSVLILRMKHVVEDIVDQGSSLKFTLRNYKSELIDGQMKESEFETVETVEKSNSVLKTESIKNNLITKFKPFAADVSISEKGPDRISYHNLTKIDGYLTIPTKVKNRPNCGGLEERICQTKIPAVQVSFDQIEWYGNDGKKVSVLYIKSAHVPFLATDLSTCLEAVQNSNGQIYKVRQCTETVDFTFGNLPPHPAP